MFIWLKKRYSHIFYSYTASALAKDTGLSRNTINAYIKRFLDMGWCSLHRSRKKRSANIRHKNLLFLNLNKLELGENYKRIKKSFEISAEGSVKDIELAIQELLLRIKHDQFKKMQELGKDYHNPTNLKAHKAAARYIRKKNICPEKLPAHNSEFRITLKSLGKLWKCSAATAHTIVFKLKSAGRLVVNSHQRAVYANDKRMASALRDNYAGFYMSGSGNYIVVFPNAYAF